MQLIVKAHRNRRRGYPSFRIPLPVLISFVLPLAGCERPTDPAILERVSEIDVMPSSLRLIQGREAVLHVVLRGASGETLDRPVGFTVADGSFAEVDESGVVSGLALGTTTVRVRVDARMVDVPVRIVTGENEIITPLEGIVPNDLNNLGWLVGFVTDAQGGVPPWEPQPPASRRAVLWRDGKVTEIHPPHLATSSADRVNDRRRIAGSGRTTSGGYVLWIWDDGAVRDVPVGSPPAPGLVLTDLGVTGLNDQGEIVGWAAFETASGEEQERAFHWDGSVFAWLPPASPPSLAPRPAITDEGVIAYHHSIFDHGVVREIEFDDSSGPSTSDGAQPRWTLTDMTEQGHLVGWFYDPPYGASGFRGPGHDAEHLSFLPLVAVNEYEDAVGTLSTTVACSTTCRGRLVRGGVVRPVAQPHGQRIYRVTRINDLGQMLAQVSTPQYPDYSPAAWALLEPE